MATEKKVQKVIVVGAGPVGTLAALYAAQRGHHVEVYELRGGKSHPAPALSDEEILLQHDPTRVFLSYIG